MLRSSINTSSASLSSRAVGNQGEGGGRGLQQFLQHLRQALIFGTDNFRLMDLLLTPECSLKTLLILGCQDCICNIFTFLELRAEWEYDFKGDTTHISPVRFDCWQYYHVADLHIVEECGFLVRGPIKSFSMGESQCPMVGECPTSQYISVRKALG